MHYNLLAGMLFVYSDWMRLSLSLSLSRIRRIINGYNTMIVNHLYVCICNNSESVDLILIPFIQSQEKKQQKKIKTLPPTFDSIRFDGIQSIDRLMHTRRGRELYAAYVHICYESNHTQLHSHCYSFCSTRPFRSLAHPSPPPISRMQRHYTIFATNIWNTYNLLMPSHPDDI
jgi:hypothetical protein